MEQGRYPQANSSEDKTKKVTLKSGKARMGSSQKEGLLSVSRRSHVMIPAYSPSPILRRTVRWTFGGTNFSGTFQMLDGHNQFLVGNTTTVCSTYIDVWRIRQIRIFGRNTEGGYSSQIQFIPTTSTTDNYITAVPVVEAIETQSVSEAVQLTITPKQGHPLGMWHRTNTNNPSSNLFQIATSTSGGSGVDQNSFMEIDFEYFLNIVGNQTGYQLTGLTGIVVGNLYSQNIFGGLMLVLDSNVA